MVEENRTLSGSYRQNWTAYNAAQTNEKPLFFKLLHELCQGVEEFDRSTDHFHLPLRDMIFCMVYKVYSGRSARRLQSELRALKDEGWISVVPHFNSILNYQELESLRATLQQLIRECCVPLRGIENRFAADSTGLSIPLRRRYYDRHKGRFRMKRGWVKVHAMGGVLTNIITSAEVSEGEAGDSPFFQGLVRDTARYFEMLEVYADGAYTGNDNRRCVLIWGADPYIAFRSNSVADGEPKSILWKRMLQQFQDKQSEFWEHYYARNNIESTFSMMKRKFGDKLFSKSFPAQVNEALCMVLCHNLCVIIQSMYELGIDPDFHADAAIRQPVHVISEQEITKVRERLAALTVKQPSFWNPAEDAQPIPVQAESTSNEDALPQTPPPKARRRARKKDSKQLKIFS
jgi:hypothetical protein